MEISQSFDSTILTHFCTATGQPVLVGDEPIKEKLICLAQYFAPEAEFTVGTVYPGITKPEDLRKHPDKSLEFSAHERMYFASRKGGEGLRDSVMDDPSLGAAYGSNIFTPLKFLTEVKHVNVLVVDWKTGENARVVDPKTGEKKDAIPRDIALQLVGEGDGRIDNGLNRELGNAKNTQFKFRGGIKQQENYPVNQFFKGTMAPLDLKKTLAPYFPPGQVPDLIISTDQTKGRINKDNPKGLIDPNTGKPYQVGNVMKPGQYTVDVAIGKVKDAHLHLASTGAQYLNALGEAVLPGVKSRQLGRLAELKEMLGDPRKIALDYIKQSERRKQLRLSKEYKDEFGEELNRDEGDVLNSLSPDSEEDYQDPSIVKQLKADLANHLQLIETPRIIDKLQDHYRRQVLDCALGKFLKFESSMVLTSRKLADNEICVPHLPDGADIVLHRPSVRDSNVIAVLANKHIKGDPLNSMRHGSIMLNPNTAHRHDFENGKFPAGRQLNIKISVQPQKNDPSKFTGFAMLDGKKLARIEKTSFENLENIMKEGGIDIKTFDKIMPPMTVDYALSNAVTVQVDPSTFKYPEQWRRDNQAVWSNDGNTPPTSSSTDKISSTEQISLIERISPILESKYGVEKDNLDSLVFDDSAVHNTFDIHSAEFIGNPVIQELSEEIAAEFGAVSFIQESKNQAGVKEIYYCIELTPVDEDSKKNILDTLKFPDLYDAEIKGKRETYIAIPLKELNEIAGLRTPVTPIKATEVKPTEVKPDWQERLFKPLKLYLDRNNVYPSEQKNQLAYLDDDFSAVFNKEKATLSVVKGDLLDKNNIVYQQKYGEEATILPDDNVKSQLLDWADRRAVARPRPKLG